MRKLVGNPLCLHCNSPHTRKNKVVYKTSGTQGYYQCMGCNHYFFGPAYKPYKVDTKTRCRHCRIGMPKHKSSRYKTRSGVESQCYICLNCKRVYSANPSPCSLRRRITLKEMLRLRNQGISYREIATVAGVSATSVWRYLGREVLE